MEFNTLKSTVNEATMIEQQAESLKRQIQSLTYQAQNLQRNPLQLLSQIQNLWSRYNDLLNRTTGLTYRLNQSGSQFDTLYTSATAGRAQDLQQASAALREQMRVASKTAVQTQSIYEQLCDLQAQNQQALASAQDAVGALQVEQALAQQQALSNQQLGTLAAVEAANGRMQAAWMMKQVQEEEAARVSNERWMEGFGAQGFRGVKEGQGVPLP